MKKALFFVFMFLLFACAQKEEPSYQMGTIVPFYYGQSSVNTPVTPKVAPIRVGMLLPLSGKYATLGDDLRNAGILAQFTVAPDNFELLFYDTKGTPEGALQAFKKAKNERVEVILGPVFSPEVAKIASEARWYNIPVFSFTSDKENLGKGVYSMALTIQNQTERIIRFACEKGARRLAIMAPDNKAGDIAVDMAKRTALACGMDIAHLSVYNPTFINFDPYVVSVLPENYVQHRKNKRQEKKDLRSGRIKLDDIVNDETEEAMDAPLTVAEQLDFDALFIADDGNRLKSISSLFGLYDVTPDDVLFLGLSTWNDASLSKEGSLKNAYYPALPTKAYKVFADKFKQTYGKDPNRLSSLAYDSVALIALLTQEDNWQEIINQNREGFLGTDGSFRFNKDGTVERLMGIYQIRRSNSVTRIEHPGTSFVAEDNKKQHLDDIRQYNLMTPKEIDSMTTEATLTD